jgi:hypothetical protein
VNGMNVRTCPGPDPLQRTERCAAADCSPRTLLLLLSLLTNEWPTWVSLLRPRHCGLMKWTTLNVGVFGNGRRKAKGSVFGRDGSRDRDQQHCNLVDADNCHAFHRDPWKLKWASSPWCPSGRLDGGSRDAWRCMERLWVVEAS